MKITAVETLRLGEFANLLWVRLHTDEGLVGLGETFMGAAAVEASLAAAAVGAPFELQGARGVRTHETTLPERGRAAEFGPAFDRTVTSAAARPR